MAGAARRQAIDPAPPAIMPKRPWGPRIRRPAKPRIMVGPSRWPTMIRGRQTQCRRSGGQCGRQCGWLCCTRKIVLSCLDRWRVKLADGDAVQASEQKTWSRGSWLTPLPKAMILSAM